MIFVDPCRGRGRVRYIFSILIEVGPSTHIEDQYQGEPAADNSIKVFVVVGTLILVFLIFYVGPIEIKGYMAEAMVFNATR